MKLKNHPPTYWSSRMTNVHRTFTHILKLEQFIISEVTTSIRFVRSSSDVCKTYITERCVFPLCQNDSGGTMCHCQGPRDEQSIKAMFGGSFNGRSINDAEKDKLRECHSCVSLRWPWHGLICKTKGHIYRHLCLDPTWHRFSRGKDNVSVNKATVWDPSKVNTTHTHALVGRKSRQIMPTETYHWIRERWGKQMGSKGFNYINVPITGDMKQSDFFNPRWHMIHSSLEHNNQTH